MELPLKYTVLYKQALLHSVQYTVLYKQADVIHSIQCTVLYKQAGVIHSIQYTVLYKQALYKQAGVQCYTSRRVCVCLCSRKCLSR